MARKSRKSTTIAMLREYLSEGKPITLRNKILTYNERLICWFAKKYQIDGYVSYEDLRQEGFLIAINFMDNILDEHSVQNFAVHLCSKLKYGLKRYQTSQKCQMTEEATALRRAVNAYTKYIRHNRDECILGVVDDYLTEENGFSNIKPTNTFTYFSERIDPDTLSVEPEDVEIVTIGDIIKCLSRMFHLSQKRTESLLLLYSYEAQHYGVKYYMEDVMNFTDLQYKSILRLASNAKAHIRSEAKHLLDYRKLSYVTDLLSICDESCLFPETLKYKKNAQEDNSTFTDNQSSRSN